MGYKLEIRCDTCKNEISEYDDIICVPCSENEVSDSRDKIVELEDKIKELEVKNGQD